MAVKKTATVTRVTSFGPASTLVELAPPADSPLGFVGGQYLIVNAGSPGPGQRDLKRAYSILSSDADQGRFALAAQLLPGGFGSAFLNVVEVGQEISFSGPWGKLAAAPWPLASEAGERWVIATDTGITAALGLLQASVFRPYLAHTRLLWLRHEEAGFLSENFVRESLPSALQWVAFGTLAQVGTPERAADACATVASWLQEGSRPLGTLPGMVFLAGDGLVIQALQALLAQVGLQPEQIRSELFFNKPT